MPKTDENNPAGPHNGDAPPWHNLHLAKQPAPVYTAITW